MDSHKSKRCSRCQQPRPLVDFHRSRAASDGLSPRCKTCSREYLREWQAKNRARHSDYNCDWYFRNKPKVQAYKKRHRKANRDQIRLAKKAYHEKNRKSIISRVAAWRHTNPERHRLNGARREARKRALPNSWNQSEQAIAIQYWGGACAVCDKRFGVRTKCHWDHWVPLASPDCPGTVAANMVPLCATCNTQKKHRDAAEWVEFQFGKRRAVGIVRKIGRFFAAITIKTNGI